MEINWFWVKYVLAAPQTWFFAVFGALVGSFLNVCILRIPEKTFFQKARSHCPHCDALIPAYLNIPIFSYFMLKGRTRCCKMSLSIQYPLVEAITAFGFVFLYWHFPFVDISGGRLDWSGPEFLRFLHAAVFFCILLTCSVIDIRLMIIPDVISLPMIAATPLLVYLGILTWQSALIGVLLGGGVLYLIAWTYYLVRGGIGMGFGDVKLLAGIGGWLGYEAVLPTLFYGSLLGALIHSLIIIVKREGSMTTALPFGPYLAAGALIDLLYGQPIREFLLV